MDDLNIGYELNADNTQNKDETLTYKDYARRLDGTIDWGKLINTKINTDKLCEVSNINKIIECDKECCICNNCYYKDLCCDNANTLDNPLECEYMQIIAIDDWDLGLELDESED